MNTLIITSAALAVLTVLVIALCARTKNLTGFANIAEGTHTDSVTKLTDAAITTRHLLYKVGSDADHIAVAGANDVAIGTVADEASAAEEYVAVDLLGKGPTKRMVANAAMTTTGVPVFQAAAGKIALTGQRQVGILLQTSGADGDVVEVDDRVSTVLDGGVLVTAAKTLTEADSGVTQFLDLAGGFTVTLPALKLGLRFPFVVKTAPTTAYIIASATNDNIIGWPSNIGGADSVADGNAAGDVLNFVANVALAGDMAEFFCDGTSWHVRAHAKAINAITITG
jgi:hypothetical protein